MAGYGFGFGSHKNGSARIAAVSHGSFVPLVVPSLLWNGAAGSGFTAVPSDPVRSTAKPTLRLIVPPNQYFTDELLVGVMAAANDGGTLIANMGLNRLVVHCEGASRNIKSPSFQTIADANGTYRTYFAWWALLRHDGRHGHAQVYFEAVPNDPAMQNRVIGPYQFSAQARLHDASVTVAASGGADFQTVGDALAHCRANAFNNPHVSITEPGNYDIADGAQAYEGQGYCTISAASPGVIIAKPGYTTDAAAAIRTKYGGLRFRGANLTIDMRYISEIHSENGATRFHWMDGCTIINSAGQGALWRGVIRPTEWIVRDKSWFTECSVQNCSDAFRQAQLVRGSTEVNGWKDLYADCPMVVGNVSSGHRGDTTLAKDVPAISVRYTGTAATATIALAGSNELAIRTVTVKIAGSADRSFALEKSEAAYKANTHYTLQNLVSWLNTIPSLSATILDASSGRAAAWLSLAGLAGAEFDARDMKAGTLQLVTYIDVTSSWWQSSNIAENVILWGNVATGIVARDFNLGGVGAKRDVLIANNAIQNDKKAVQSTALYSQFDGANSHVVCAHNTLSTQAIVFKTDAAYASFNSNLFANNSVRGITWAGSAAATSILNNHIHADQTVPTSAPGQGNVAGTTIGGSDVSLYASDRAGDFRAKGALISSLSASVLPYNGSNEALAEVDVKGAYKALPERVVSIASSVTYMGVTYGFSEPRPVKQYPSGDYRVLAPVTILSTSVPSVQVSGGYMAGTATYANKWAHGMEKDPGNLATAVTPYTLIGDQTAINQHNQNQGLTEIPKSATSLVFVPYTHALNVDPGATGVPLVLNSPATLWKAVSRDGQDGRDAPNTGQRPALHSASRLIVVDDLSEDDALPPGTAQADKTHYFTERDWDVSIFPNKPKVAGAETVDAICARLIAPWPMQATDMVNGPTFGTQINGHDGYPRVPGQNVGFAAAALVCDYSAADKRKLLNYLWPIAVDSYARAKEGGNPVGTAGSLSGGNGTALRKVAMSMCFAALHNADTLPGAQAKLADMIATCQGWYWPEDKQVPEVTQAMLAVPRSTSDPSRPVDELPQWTEGAYDFSPNGGGMSGMGTNWDGQYRTVCGEAGTIGAIAALATPAAKAVWGRDPTLEYHKTYIAEEKRLNRYGAPYTVTYGGVLKQSPYTANMLSTADKAIIAAILPSDPVPPTPLWAKVRGNTLWVHFDKNLDEGTAVSAASYVVKKGGVVVSGVTIAPPPALAPRTDPDYVPDQGFVPNGIWRSNIGLILPAASIFGEEYTVDYIGGAGANKLRSVLDNVNVAAFTNLAVENVTESVGGANAAYPIVQFSKTRPDRYRASVATAIHTATSPLVTLWMPHIKLFSLPSANVELFGYSGSTPVFEIIITTTGAVRVAVRSTDGTTGYGPTSLNSTNLALNTAYSYRLDLDVTDPTVATAYNVYLNGVAAKGTAPGSFGGAGRYINWLQSLQWSLGGTHSTDQSTSFDGEFGGLWLMPGARVTDPAQVAKFTSLTNGSLDIGTLGEGITGTPPAMFIVGNAAQYNDPAGINRGTGPKFTRLSGGVVDVAAIQASLLPKTSQWR